MDNLVVRLPETISNYASGGRKTNEATPSERDGVGAIEKERRVKVL